MNDDDPPSPSRRRVDPLMHEITAQQLAYYLFGNPLNPQDKGIIGAMQDQVRQLIRLGWALFFVFLTAMLGILVDLIMKIKP